MVRASRQLATGRSYFSHSSTTRRTDTPPTRVELIGQNGPLPVPLMRPEEYKWVQIKTLSAYRNEAYDDTCKDFIMPDFEYDEMLLQQSQDNWGRNFAQRLA